MFIATLYFNRMVKFNKEVDKSKIDTLLLINHKILISL